jgi:CheY-like chemotaxis protein
MLTAAAANEDLVGGLGLGADDYLPKPFDFPVLVARIGALARRAHPAVPPVLRHADLVVDTARRRAWRAGSPLELSPKEFGVLELLAAAGGRAVSAEELLERVWDEFADPFSTAVKITVSRRPSFQTAGRSAAEAGFTPRPSTGPGRQWQRICRKGRSAVCRPRARHPDPGPVTARARLAAVDRRPGRRSRAPVVAFEAEPLAQPVASPDGHALRDDYPDHGPTLITAARSGKAVSS